MFLPFLKASRVARESRSTGWADGRSSDTQENGSVTGKTNFCTGKETGTSKTHSNFLINIVLFEEFIWRESGFSCFFCVGIHHLLVTVINLNNQIMTPESGIMDGRRQNKVYRLPPFFSLGHFQLALPADFLFRPGARFSKDLECFRARRQILKSQLLQHSS